VIGFPFGYNAAAIKKEEARLALQDGADELDLVINTGDLKQGKYEQIAAEINDVVMEAKQEEDRRRKRVQVDQTCPLTKQVPADSSNPSNSTPSSSSFNMSLDPILVKVILETAVLTPDEIIDACLLASLAEASFVKTSTGFSSAGGASVESVRLMRAVVGDKMGVKASGGIRDWVTAKKMIEAGATRLGLSSSVVIVEQERASRNGSYNTGINPSSSPSPSVSSTTNSSPSTY